MTVMYTTSAGMMLVVPQLPAMAVFRALSYTMGFSRYSCMLHPTMVCDMEKVVWR